MRAVPEAEMEETRSDDEWVVVSHDQNWVIVNLVESDEKHADASDDENHEEKRARCDGFDEAKNSDRGDGVDNTEMYEDGDDDGLGCSEGAYGKEEEEDDDGALEYEKEEEDDDGTLRPLKEADAHSYSDDEASHGYSDGAYEDEEAAEDDDEDYYTHIDCLHDSTLQYEANKRTDTLIDAAGRYYMDPVGESWQEYVCSVQTKPRKELHATKMASFRGFGPDPEPFMYGSNCFNPLFEHMWLPWAIDAEYCHNEDMGLLVCDPGDTGLMLRQLAAEQYMSSAVPTRPLLEYMVNSARYMEIVHMGSCSSLYWAVLLQRLGAKNVIVTEGPFCDTITDESFSCIDQIGEETFFSRNIAGTQALFFLRPSKRSRACFTERCLFCFSGDTIFFVGETGEYADNFDMAQWVEEHKHEGWRVEREMEIPCWPGSHDVFLCITKAKMPIDNTA